MKYRLFLLLVLVAFGWNCRGSRTTSGNLRMDQEVVEMAAVWRGDRLGCAGARTEAAALELLEAFKQMPEVRFRDIEEILGPFETVQTRNNLRVMGYYFDTECTRGEIREETAWCVLEFYFEMQGGFLEDGMAVCG